VDAHLLADDLDHRQRTVVDVHAGAPLVDRERGLVACATAQMMFFGPKAASPREHLGVRRGHGLGVDLGHVPFGIELDADVALDPGEGVLLADRDEHVVAGMCWSGSPVGTRSRRPLASRTAWTFSNRTPVSLPLSWVNSFGTR